MLLIPYLTEIGITTDETEITIEEIATVSTVVMIGTESAIAAVAQGLRIATDDAVELTKALCFFSSVSNDILLSTINS
jgi:hypothetical protein